MFTSIRLRYFALRDGREVIAHCPDHYNIIEIEEIESGNRLTSRTGEAADFFHSRLQVSSDSKYLLSAGWVWHPWDTIQLFDIEHALQSPESLDRNWEGDLSNANVGEIHTAAFNGPDLIVFAGDDEEEKGRQNSSIIYHLGHLPPIALDPLNRRFAVADSEAITVVHLG
jgi:hypothetical protein